MRHGLCSVCSAALLGVGLVASAQAQTRPGWVDPPARTEPAPDKPKSELKAEPKAAAAPEISAPPQTSPKAARSEMAAPQRDPARRVSEARQAAPARPERPHRRLARTPATMPPQTLPAAMPPGAAEARFPDWAATSQRLTDAYLDSVSAPGHGMVAAAPRFYGEQVRFHGRTLSLAALMAEKRRFVRRWPERRYAAQGGATRTACHAATATCIVRTTYDFRADNPARGARSQGVSELVLTVSFAGERPLIVAESSRVLRRYGSGPLSAVAGSARGA